MSTKVWILVIGVALAGTGWALRDRLRSAFAGQEEAAVEGTAVRRGPLRISVVERGNLKAAASIDLKSEVEGQTTILYLIPEGKLVKAGDLLCELDTADLIDRRVQQDISVQNSEAAYVKAKQNYEIQQSQNESEIARAERELEFAKVDLEKYIEGDWPQEQRAAEEGILLADEELTRAKQDLEWSERLAEKGFLENTQLDADRLARTRAEITVNQRKRALELLQDYEFPRRKRELEADVEESVRELDRVRLQAKARIVDFEAEMRTSKARFDLEREKLAKLDSQIEKAKIHAPVDGMVVYYQEAGRRWGNSEPIQEGSVVRERQEIITIPSTEGMVAEASLHESVLDRVREGMACVVTVDAIPGKTFRGEVKYKAVLPDQNSWWANPDLRVYRSEVRLFDTDERLRPGMSASIEIVVAELEDVLYMPLQSVYLDHGQPVAFVAGPEGIEKRSIKAGQNNGKWVVIEEGLREGETVLLSQPAGFGLQAAPLDDGGGEQREGAEERGQPDQGGRGKKPGGGGRPGGRESASAAEGRGGAAAAAPSAAQGPAAASDPADAERGTEGAAAGRATSERPAAAPGGERPTAGK